MTRCSRPIAFVVAVVFVATLGGCGGSSGASSGGEQKLAETLITLVSMEYGAYMAANNNAVPPTPEAFKKFLDTRASMLETYNVKSVPELLTSPRDKQEFVIVCGRKLAPSDSPETPWAAYEKVGVDGKHLAVAYRGKMIQLTDAELAQEIPTGK